MIKISIKDEHGHYLLECDGVQMRCDTGELNEAIPEFEEYYNNRKKLQKK